MATTEKNFHRVTDSWKEETPRSATFLSLHWDLSHSPHMNLTHFSSVEMAPAPVYHSSDSPMTVVFQPCSSVSFRQVTLLMIRASSLPPSIFTSQNFLGSCEISAAIRFLSSLPDPSSSFFSDPKFRCPLSVLFDLLSSLSRSHNSKRGPLISLFHDLN